MTIEEYCDIETGSVLYDSHCDEYGIVVNIEETMFDNYFVVLWNTGQWSGEMRVNLLWQCYHLVKK